MRIIIVLSMLLLLPGCSVLNMIPSFSDINQSHSIVRAQLLIDSINCNEPQLAQAIAIERELRYFELYSQSRGRNEDVIRIFTPIRTTVLDWKKRSQEGVASHTYCEMKQKILIAQTGSAAKAILGRYP